jgi:hypothetical protein
MRMMYAEIEWMIVDIVQRGDVVVEGVVRVVCGSEFYVSETSRN